jgi:5-bromo-4-chloroindolyl phosphate hydrolysis protein
MGFIKAIIFFIFSTVFIKIFGSIFNAISRKSNSNSESSPDGKSGWKEKWDNSINNWKQNWRSQKQEWKQKWGGGWDNSAPENNSPVYREAVIVTPAERPEPAASAPPPPPPPVETVKAEHIEPRHPSGYLRSKNLPDGQLKTVILRCEERLAEIHELRKKIVKPDIKTKVSEITETIENIMDVFIERPASLKTAKRFTDYYLDATIKILKKYNELAGYAVKSPTINTGISKAETAMDTIRDAFSNLFFRLKEDDLMDLNTEIKVLENEIKMDGYK